MADSKDKQQVKEEVGDRLDAFFSDEDWEEDALEADDTPSAAAAAPEEPAISVPAGPSSDEADELGIKDLKVLILSLDWEITDSLMEKLDTEIKNLRVQWKDNPIFITYLSLLELLGKYIRVKKASANPESIGLLRQVYDSLEQALVNPDEDEAAKKRAVLAMVERFNRLKKQISGKAAAAPAPTQVVDAAPLQQAEVIADDDAEVVDTTPAVTVAPVAAAPVPGGDALSDLREQVAGLKQYVETELRSLSDDVKSAFDSISQAMTDLSSSVAALKTALQSTGVEVPDAPPVEAQPIAATVVTEEVVEEVADEMGIQLEEVPPQEEAQSDFGAKLEEAKEQKKAVAESGGGDDLGLPDFDQVALENEEEDE